MNPFEQPPVPSAPTTNTAPPVRDLTSDPVRDLTSDPVRDLTSDPVRDLTTVMPTVPHAVDEIRLAPSRARRQRRLAAGAGALAATLLVIGCTAGSLTGGGSDAATTSVASLPAGSLPDGSLPTGIDPAGVGSTGIDPASADANGGHDSNGGNGGNGGSGGNGGDGGNGGNGDDGSPEAPDDATEDALDEQDDGQGYDDGEQPQPEQPEPQGEGPVELEPVEPPAPQPCDSLPAGASLLVGPDPLVLQPDRAKGTITVTNCSDGDVDWTAASKPSIGLSSAGANLLPGETVELGFTIDLDAWDPGAIEFKIKVAEPGANHYVDVYAYDTLFGIEAAAGAGTLSAGAGVGGCGNQCITGAWLTPNATTPNPTLHVTTNTPARIRVWVSPNAPQVDDGIPGYAGAALATSAVDAQALDTVLQPLTAGQRYHVLITATDADGDVAWFTDDFVATTPVQGPGGLAGAGGPSGCSAQCITSALVTPGADHSEAGLAITTHTPARFQVSVDPSAPVEIDGRPSLPDAEIWLNSGEQFATDWAVDLTDLAPETTYHAVVSATDAQGRTSYRTGSFDTPAAPVLGTTVGLELIEFTYDGDKGDWNRGEVSFAWGLVDFTVASWGERKVRDGDTFTPSSGNRWDILGHGDYIPAVYVSTAERDADGLREFCTHGFGVIMEPTHVGSCDISINVAVGGIMEHHVADLPRCVDLGVANIGPEARCQWIESTIAEGYDTEFRALISYENI